MSIWKQAAQVLHRGVIGTLGEQLEFVTATGARFTAAASWQRESDETDDQGVVTIFARMADLPRELAPGDRVAIEGDEYRVQAPAERRDGGLQVRAEKIERRRA